MESPFIKHSLRRLIKREFRMSEIVREAPQTTVLIPGIRTFVGFFVC